jgi:predicted CopG family antitoxin
MYDDFADMPSGLQAAELISRIKGPRNTINYEAAEMFIGKKLKGNESVNELIEMLVEKKAEGGRIGFSKGKLALADAARRKFLKLAGSGAAGLAALKTGLLGFGKEAAPVVEKAAETVSNTMGEAPAYFLNLIKKIKNLGSEYSPKYSGGREKITNYKDYTLTEDLTTGETTIQRFKQSEVDYYDEMLMEENYMNYRPGIADETTKGKTPPGEYTEDTGYLRTSGPSKGDLVIEGEPIPKDIIEEGTMFEDNMTEFGKTKKASGGIARMIGE